MSRIKTQYWLVLLVSVISVATGTVFVVRHVLSPSDGARLYPGGDSLTPEGAVLQVLKPQPGGLESNDLVLSVNGRSLEDWSDSLFNQADHVIRKPGEAAVYEVLRAGERVEVAVVFSDYPLQKIILENWGTILFGLAYFLVAGFVFIRRPESKAGQILFLSSAGLAGSTAWSFGLTIIDFLDGTGFWIFKAATFFFYNLAWTAGFHFALLFPRPFSINRRRGFLPAVYILPFILELGYLLYARQISSGNLEWFSRWTPAEGLHAAVFLLGTIVAIGQQLKRARGRTDQQQVRWVVLAGVLAGSAGLIFYILPPFLGFQAVTPNLIGLVVLAFPVALAIAILRHNLFNIDKLINRALVYSALTTGTMLFYVIIVGVVGSILQTDRQGIVAFVTTGLVALLFQPLRASLQRTVNRFMYGDRDDPYSVLKSLGQRLQNTLAPREVIPAIVETVAEALKLPYTGIQLNSEQKFSYGVPPRRVRVQHFPLSYQGETFGRLEVAQRGPGEPLTDDEISLINDLARQIEVAVHDVRLNQDLQRSRQRLVTAREEERRRIRRDLHDGLGPQLASQMLTLDAMDKLLDRDPNTARKLLHSLKDQSQSAIADIRGLIYGLRPPVLDDLGLVEALRQVLSDYNQPPVIVFDSPQDLPQLPAAIELAVYRIVLEAVNNVVKHAGAEYCHVKIELLPDNLQVIVSDDGTGLPSARKSGVGTHTMRERAEELGGTLTLANRTPSGTVVTAILPLHEENK